MEINLYELRKANDKIFEYLAEIGVEKVSIPYENYWEIPKEKKYDSYDEPTDLSLGQLSDDLDEIKKIASGENYPISYALKWLATIYSAISQEIPYKH